MGMKTIRLLRADEIECRISTINEKGLSLLLFKDARVDQRILDETFTPMGWKRTHQYVNGSLYCTVEVWDEEKKQWIAKQDVGTMSYAEKEKGQASDSFKRACFNWGIGRELYTAPFIWVPASRVQIERRGDKFYCREPFSVSRIGYDEIRSINELIIIGTGGRVLYSLLKEKGVEEHETAGKQTEGSRTAGKQEKAKRTETGWNPALDSGQIDAFEKELKRTGVALEAVLSRYRITDTGQMTEDIYKRAMRDLKKSRNAA